MVAGLPKDARQLLIELGRTLAGSKLWGRDTKAIEIAKAWCMQHRQAIEPLVVRARTANRALGDGQIYHDVRRDFLTRAISDRHTDHILQAPPHYLGHLLGRATSQGAMAFVHFLKLLDTLGAELAWV